MYSGLMVNLLHRPSHLHVPFCARLDALAPWVRNCCNSPPNDALYTIMQVRVLHTLDLTAAVVGQTILLAAG